MEAWAEACTRRTHRKRLSRGGIELYPTAELGSAEVETIIESHLKWALLPGETINSQQL